MSENQPIREGWGIEKPDNKRKYCYFVNGRALCGRWHLYAGELSSESDDHPENCGSCKKKLAVRRKKQTQKAV